MTVRQDAKGYAQSSVTFTYELTLSSVQPSEGKWRGTETDFYFLLILRRIKKGGKTFSEK